MPTTEDIVELIRRNRISTTEVADAMGKAGVLDGAAPVTPDLHRVGPIRTVFASGGSNHGVHEALPSAEAGEVVVVFTHDCDGRAIIGDLMAKYATLYRDVAAVVIDGLVRDASRLRRERYPIWAHGYTPLGCVNRPMGEFPAAERLRLQSLYDGGVAVCDDGGVVLVPASHIADDLVDRLERIELQEDVWYYCLDTLKWDTKRIVCDRDYLHEAEVLPPRYRELLQQLEKRFEAME
jgi:4-hydroxy-4-methyl-2-oxoglutarate aldolase